jgi:hypothetical protein
VQVVGLGAQDDEALARAFTDEFGLRSVRMVWDPTRESWRELGISAQPAAILFDAGGAEVRRWFGPFDLDEVLVAARS